MPRNFWNAYIVSWRLPPPVRHKFSRAAERLKGKRFNSYRFLFVFGCSELFFVPTLIYSMLTSGPAENERCFSSREEWILSAAEHFLFQLKRLGFLHNNWLPENFSPNCRTVPVNSDPRLQKWRRRYPVNSNLSELVKQTLKQEPSSNGPSMHASNFDLYDSVGEHCLLKG